MCPSECGEMHFKRVGKRKPGNTKRKKKARRQKNKTVRQAAEEGRKVAFYGRTYKFLFRVPERTRQEKEMTLSIVSKAYRYLDTVG